MPTFTNALPHWMCKEYFEELELFLDVPDVALNFNHLGKHITFAVSQATRDCEVSVVLEI